MSLERNALVGLCPTAPLMALGTVAGAIDMSFSTSSVLEVRDRAGPTILCPAGQGTSFNPP